MFAARQSSLNQTLGDRTGNDLVRCGTTRSKIDVIIGNMSKSASKNSPAEKVRKLSIFTLKALLTFQVQVAGKK